MFSFEHLVLNEMIAEGNEWVITNSGAVVRMAEFTETFQIYSYRTWVGGLTEGKKNIDSSK